MTPESKSSILDILRSFRLMSGVDVQKIDSLILDMEGVDVRHESDFDRSVKETAHLMAQKIGYSITAENNESRDRDLVAQRQAIMLSVYERYGRNKGVYRTLCSVFGKDMSTISHSVHKAHKLLSVKDKKLCNIYQEIKNL